MYRATSSGLFLVCNWHCCWTLQHCGEAPRAVAPLFRKQGSRRRGTEPLTVSSVLCHPVGAPLTKHTFLRFQYLSDLSRWEKAIGSLRSRAARHSCRSHERAAGVSASLISAPSFSRAALSIGQAALETAVSQFVLFSPCLFFLSTNHSVPLSSQAWQWEEYGG